jgi:O-antigen/teichoic acid export membrane protein
MTVSGTLLSLLMVLLMQDKLAGRLFGYYIPHIAIGAGVFVLLVARGKKIKTEYWKYACVICLPLVPHELSLYVLSVSDKVIITRLSGVEYNAVYSIAYSAYHIATVLLDSMNKAFAPWLLESLHHENYNAVKKTSKVYIGIFAALVVGILALAPEIIWLLGGKQYAGAVNCIPPLIASCVFQLIYRMYVNIEFYEKKTIGVAVATMIAATVNIVLNFILIPLDLEHSYVIASYTTLIGYIILFALHYFMVRHLKMDHVYDIRFILMILLGILVVAGIMNTFYGVNEIARYVLIIIYGAVIMYAGYRYKDVIIGLFKKKKNRNV